MERTLIKYGLIIFGVVLALLTAYNWAHGRGVEEQKAKDAPVIAALKADVNKKQGIIDEAKIALDKQRTDHELAIAFLRDSHQQVLDGQNKRLTQYAANEKLLKGKLNAYSKELVTANANSGCTVTAGFVWMHNLSAEGRPLTDRATTSAALSKSGFENVDSPARVELSAVGETVADNYAEAHARGEVIKEWQRWYADSYSAWERAVKIQGFVPVKIPEAP